MRPKVEIPENTESAYESLVEAYHGHQGALYLRPAISGKRVIP